MDNKIILEDMIGNRLKWLLIVLPLLAAAFWFPPAAWSDNDLMEVKVPEALNPAIEHLLALTGSGDASTFNPEVVEAFLDFVAAPKEEDRLYYVDGMSKATSAYHEFVFDKSCPITQPFLRL
jgi:hypothetical protein